MESIDDIAKKIPVWSDFRIWAEEHTDLSYKQMWYLHKITHHNEWRKREAKRRQLKRQLCKHKQSNTDVKGLKRKEYQRQRRKEIKAGTRQVRLYRRHLPKENNQKKSVLVFHRRVLIYLDMVVSIDNSKIVTDLLQRNHHGYMYDSNFDKTKDGKYTRDPGFHCSNKMPIERLNNLKIKVYSKGLDLKGMFSHEITTAFVLLEGKPLCFHYAGKEMFTYDRLLGFLKSEIRLPENNLFNLNEFQNIQDEYRLLKNAGLLSKLFPPRNS